MLYCDTHFSSTSHSESFPFRRVYHRIDLGLRAPDLGLRAPALHGDLRIRGCFPDKRCQACPDATAVDTGIRASRGAGDGATL